MNLTLSHFSPQYVLERELGRKKGKSLPLPWNRALVIQLTVSIMMAHTYISIMSFSHTLNKKVASLKRKRRNISEKLCFLSYC